MSLVLQEHLLTAFYMFRLLSLTFAGKFRGTEEQLHHVHESPAAMTFPLICLAILSAIGGFVGVPAIFMKNGDRLGDFLSPVFADSNKILIATSAKSSNGNYIDGRFICAYINCMYMGME